MVLVPLNRQELEKIFDKNAKKVITYFLEKTIMLQPELMPGQDILPIQIPKEHIEQWFVQALNAQSVGAGSYPVDILIPNVFGADVKMLSCKIDKDGNLKPRELSGETSLAQKFQNTGANLDILFSEARYGEILDGWKEILSNKLYGVMHEQKIDNIYYFFFLRAGSKFYVCGCRVQPEEISKSIVNYEKSNSNNVWVDNFINSEFGKITIYKAKKRMELRLYPYKWRISDCVIEFDTKQKVNGVNLRKLSENGQLEDYVNASFQEILDRL